MMLKLANHVSPGMRRMPSLAHVDKLHLGNSRGSVPFHPVRRTACCAKAVVVAPPAFPQQPLPASGSAGPPQVLADKTVGVVGSGLGALLCAAHLAQLGATVEVFEQYESSAVDRSKQPPKLSANVRAAIEAAGLSAEFGPQWRSEGGSAEAGTGSQSADESAAAAGAIPALVSLLSPTDVAAHVREECERVYGDAVTVTHGLRAVLGNVNVCAGELLLEDADGRRPERRFDMIVGADGARSTVRDLIQKHSSDVGVMDFHGHWGLVCIEVKLSSDPQALLTPSGEPSTAVPDTSDMLPHEAKQDFVSEDRRQQIFTSGSINVMHGGAEVLLTVVAPLEWLQRKGPKAPVLKALQQAYPQLPQKWLDDMAQHIHENALGEDPLALIRRRTYLLCIVLASGRAVLLGDAAHSMSYHPAFWHSELRDCGALAQACILAGGNIEESGRRYEDALYAYASTISNAAEKLGLSDMFPFLTLLHDAVLRSHNSEGEFEV